jgi:hypothetical protein
MKGKIHFVRSQRANAGSMPPFRDARSKFCEDNQLRTVRWRLRQTHREDLMRMRINRRTAVKSADLILIVGAVLAIAMMISAMRHNRRNLQQGLGMRSAVTAPAV